MDIKHIRTRWAAVGAAVAITLGAGGIGLVSATSPSDAVTYVPISPCRLADTRAGSDNVGPRNTPIGPNEVLGIQAEGNHGNCVGIPVSATGLQLNVTALRATTQTFLTIWGAGAQPYVSSLNPAPGQPPVPNAVTTGLTAGGAINIYNYAGTVEVIVDIVGYYTDHSHDDRYYTEAEIDASQAAQDAKTLWVVVDGNSTGAIVRQSGGISLSHADPTKAYFLTFPRSIAECVWVASLGGWSFLDNLLPQLQNRGIAATIALLPANTVAVSVYNESHDLVPNAFSLMMTCP